MWEVLVSTTFYISCQEGLPGIWSMKFCVPFLIIPNAPITTGIIFVLRFNILVTSISRSLYFESFWNSFNAMFWSEGNKKSGRTNLHHDGQIIMQVRSSWLFIIISVLFASTFLSDWTVKLHSMVTFFLSTTGSGVFLYHFSVCGSS